MKVRIRNKIYKSIDEPILVIFENNDRELIASMDMKNNSMVFHPSKQEWINDGYDKLNKWMDDAQVQAKKTIPSDVWIIDQMKRVQEEVNKLNLRIDKMDEIKELRIEKTKEESELQINVGDEVLVNEVIGGK